MWKRTKRNLNGDGNKAKEHGLSDTATKAMFDYMAGVCMTMGMTYGVYVYVPTVSTMYGYSNNM